MPSALSPSQHTLKALLAERQRLGALQTYRITAPSLVEAHRLLGRYIGPYAQAAMAKKLNATDPDQLKQQIAAIRHCREFVEKHAAQRAAPAIREAIQEYFACLAAWSETFRFDMCTADKTLSPLDLALWAQHDNTGCQTGMLRQSDGSVLLWHTEEDTIGYLDQPRMVEMCVQGVTRSAFLYPYLLPGPAFGWGNGQFHALDSLSMHAQASLVGAITNIAAWLIWRLGPAIPTAEVIHALSPYIDACAINVMQPTPREVLATTYEFGHNYNQSRPLGRHAQDLIFQVNVVDNPHSPLGELEAVSPQEYPHYAARICRTKQAIEHFSRQNCPPTPQDILTLMTCCQGADYAYANVDVKALCIVEITPHAINLYAAAGPALTSDRVHMQSVHL